MTKIVKNMVFGYVLGFTFMGWGCAWFIPDYNWAWSAGIVGAITFAFLPFLVKESIISTIFLFMLCLSISGAVSMLIGITFNIQTPALVGAPCTVAGVGLFIALLFLIKRRTTSSY